MTLPDAATRSGFRVIRSCPSCVEIEGMGELDRMMTLCKRVLRRSCYDCIVVIHREGKKRTGYAVGMAGIQVSALPDYGIRKHVDRIGKSGYAGVFGLPSRRHGTRWIARAWNGRKYAQVGTYETPESAAEARIAYVARQKELTT
jgi:hypothetical protein